MEFFTYRLPNGIRGIHRQVKGSVAHCALVIGAGSRDEHTDQYGLAHFTEHAFFKGTEHRRAWQVNCRLENLGGELNAFTTKEDTTIHATTLRGDFAKAAELIADIAFRSTFPDRELYCEKELLAYEINTYKDSPAEGTGIHVGDLITDVILDDGSRESVVSLGYDVALTKLRGESGTTAHFVVARDEDGDGVYDELEFTVERKKIDAESVMARLYEPDPTIAVIRITGFEKNTPDQFYAAMDEMKAAGAEKFVFDLRSNPGGDKDSVSSILDYLLPEGPILRTVDSDGNYKVLTTSDAKCLDMPMAVLVNGSTASAAELFAASVKDYGVGKVVGNVTYGKGSMQTMFDIFSDGSLLKLTVAYYCPPYSENYDGVGVKPDVEVALDESLAGVSIYKLSDTEDNQLTEAVKTFG